MAELVLAAFIIGVGLSVAGMGTHLYQAVVGREAVLRLHGDTILQGFGHLCLSMVCGPYLMLQMAGRPNSDGTISTVSVMLGAVIALSWAFVTGLFLLGTYVGLMAI